ncbi:hypothetical protein C7E23_08030 [Elizabethkingia anophelis]|nr:hypothetical protein C7E23_08030 [Elizabethkingia anophelis]
MFLETKLAAADVISAGYFDASSFTTIFASLCLSTAERGVLSSCPSPSFPGMVTVPLAWIKSLLVGVGIVGVLVFPGSGIDPVSL